MRFPFIEMKLIILRHAIFICTEFNNSVSNHSERKLSNFHVQFILRCPTLLLFGFIILPSQDNLRALSSIGFQKLFLFSFVLNLKFLKFHRTKSISACSLLTCLC